MENVHLEKKNSATHSTQPLSPFSTPPTNPPHSPPPSSSLSSHTTQKSVPKVSPLPSPLPQTSTPPFPTSSSVSLTSLATVKPPTTSSLLSIEKELDDINDNHVGINLNSLTSVVAAPASYAKSSSLFRNLSLISAQTMQVWAKYDAKKMEFNVTLAPLNTPKPVLPLLSYTINLSSVLLRKMYVGFSSSTGVATSSHYILRWSFCLNDREAELLAFNLLAARNETAWRSETAGCIEIETLSWRSSSVGMRSDSLDVR
ncbi:hypothetical protein IEQ34_019062 [Dendrobium chrysotoxum]|uniref:Legume lectin domain-containing protein n=1 Tax=Dendrobium chrysotoxum TaxID=161865 RepID=A0AAV7G7H1_DENCH|nr:hypothetical protein IEQ34_019062 [Dendrobium chrysotoxum]